MATTVDYIEYVCEQIQGIGMLRYRKMFGEYMVYVNEKPILLVCDNTVFVKKLPCIEALMMDAQVGYPYKGAKEQFILDIDNRDFAQTIIEKLEAVTSIPKPKVKKKKERAVN